MSSLHDDLKEASSIDVQLFPDERSITFFHQDPSDVNGWIGKNDKNTMKLIRSDGKFSGSIIIDDVTYFINTLEDGTTYFEEDEVVKEMTETIFWERVLSDVGDNCAQEEQVAFNLNMTTDNFGHETKWKLADKKGNVLLSGSQYEGNTNYLSNSCLEACSCYELTMYDTGKDGMCCNYGKGGYKVFFDGEEVASGAEFSFQQVHEIGHCQKWYSFGSKCSKKNSVAAVESFESSSPPCKSWCIKNDFPWYATESGEPQKCDWENTCAGCKQCEPGFEAFEDLPCENWCGMVGISWISEKEGGDQLCDWKESCAGCSECLV